MSVLAVPTGACCTHCGSEHDLTQTIEHQERGAYNIEPVIVCADCKPQHDADVRLTLFFRSRA